METRSFGASRALCAGLEWCCHRRLLSVRGVAPLEAKVDPICESAGSGALERATHSCFAVFHLPRTRNVTLSQISTAHVSEMNHHLGCAGRLVSAFATNYGAWLVAAVPLAAQFAWW